MGKRIEPNDIAFRSFGLWRNSSLSFVVIKPRRGDRTQAGVKRSGTPV